MLSRRSFLHYLLISAALPARGAHTPDTALRLDVVPQNTAIQTHKDWTPLIEKLNEVTGLNIELHTYGSIPDFEAALLHSPPDLAFLNPYHAVMAHRAYRLRPLIRSSTPLIGYLIVKQDSRLKTPHELEGKLIGYASPNAFAASLYIRAYLAIQEKITSADKYFKTHANVIRHVLYGDIECGGVASNAYLREPENLRQQLRILFQTPLMPSHPLAIHPRISQRIATKIETALLELARSEAGAQLFEKTSLTKPVKADYALDYAPLEKLGLDRFVVLEEE